MKDTYTTKKKHVAKSASYMGLTDSYKNKVGVSTSKTNTKGDKYSAALARVSSFID